MDCPKIQENMFFSQHKRDLLVFYKNVILTKTMFLNWCILFNFFCKIENYGSKSVTSNLQSLSTTYTLLKAVLHAPGSTLGIKGMCPLHIDQYTVNP